MQADVTQRGRPEQGIHDGMHQNIGVRVAEQAFFIGNVHTAQDQFPVLNKFVDVITGSYAHTGNTPVSFLLHFL